MRRPPKPFVTEYKPSTRRHPSPMGQAQPFGDNSDGPAAKPNEAPRFDLSPRSDDSYEAAMRAADALFSGSPPPPESTPEHAEATVETGGGAERPMGRILQAIDETPVAPIFAFEDETEPKRRGRKPGSKNKPKMPVTSIDPSSISLLDLEAYDVGVPRQQISALAADENEAYSDEIVSDEATLPSARAQTAPGPRVAIAAEPRFSWVRTQLAPGQDWKRRRLPKVCW